MIEAISPVDGLRTAPLDAQASAPATDFSRLLGEGVTRLDGSVRVADDLMVRVAAGEDVAVHDLMVAMEDARLALQFATEVRNRLVESYQEMLRMQL